MRTKVNKQIINWLSLLTVIIVATVTPLWSVSAHSLTSWANKYPSSDASGSHQFGIGDWYHINGSTVNYYWANNVTRNYFSNSFLNGVSAWGGLIKSKEVSDYSDAHIRVEYNPNKTGNYAAYVLQTGPSDHYEPGIKQTEMVIGDITNYSNTEKRQVFTHELGHLWGINDLYDYNDNLKSIYSDTYGFSAPTRHDTNAMRIGLNSLFFDTGNGWKYQKSPGVWAKNEWIVKYGKSTYFNDNGIKTHEIEGSIPTTSFKLPDGIYEIQGKTSGKLIHSASSSNGAVAHLWSSTTNSSTINNQRFKFERQSDGTYKITVLSSGSVLDNNGWSYANGNQLEFHIWHGGNNQKWYLKSYGDGYVKIFNKHSGLAIDITNNATANGTGIQQWIDSDTDAQKFKLLPTNLPSTSMNIKNGIYEIQGKTSGKLIHSANSSNGAKAHLWSSTTNSSTINNQRFKFERQSDGTYKITVLSSGSVLDNNGWSYANGNQLKFHVWHGGNNQKWYVVDCGNGYVKFINKHSGLAIDISNNGTDNGTPIQQWKDSAVGASAQRFKLLPV